MYGERIEVIEDMWSEVLGLLIQYISTKKGQLIKLHFTVILLTGMLVIATNALVWNDGKL